MRNRIGFHLAGAKPAPPSTASISSRVGRKLDDLPVGRAMGTLRTFISLFTMHRLLGWELGVKEITALSYTAYASFALMAVAGVLFWELERD